MSEAARKIATCEDLLQLPDNVVGEILDGELHTRPRPGAQHVFTTSSLGYDLIGPFQRGVGGPGGWWILDEPELLLGEQVLVPDLAGWRQERMPSLPGDQNFTRTPDWICEVLSPSTAQHDRVRKLPVYASFSIPHLWLIDPALRTLEVYSHLDNKWVLLSTHGEDETVHAPPFEAISLSLIALWSD